MLLLTTPAQSLLAQDAPEGLKFVAGEDSPTDNPLLLVANEVSGSMSVFEIEVGGESSN